MIFQITVERRNKGKASHGRKILHMTSDLMSSTKYPELKWQQKIMKDGELYSIHRRGIP